MEDLKFLISVIVFKIVEFLTESNFLVKYIADGVYCCILRHFLDVVLDSWKKFVTCVLTNVVGFFRFRICILLVYQLVLITVWMQQKEKSFQRSSTDFW